MVNEQKLLDTIVSGSDWQAVLTEIVAEEDMDPWAVDIIKLTDVFSKYLKKMKKFSFKIPARFILVAAILLRMKCELLMEEEEEKEKEEKNREPNIEIENIPKLGSPNVRRPRRKVTLNELIDALNQAFEMKEEKENEVLRRHEKVENLLEEEEDIETKIKRLVNKIKSNGYVVNFYQLVPDWNRKKIVDVFVPLLQLVRDSKVVCEQEELYSDIKIKLLGDEIEGLNS